MSQESEKEVPQPSKSAPLRWERAVLENIVLAHVREQQRARRWRYAWRFAVLLAVLVMWAVNQDLFPTTEGRMNERHTAVIEIDGVLAAGGEVDADAVIAGLQAAYEDRATAGVVLRINSPGGSPVQAGLIADEMRRLRAKHPDVPLYAVVEEVCASGGYYIAAAAERIYVDKASLVGSIGVLMDGFGFTGVMDKLGVERRLLTAGENKGFLDPFSPMTEAQRTHARTMLDAIHQQFIDVVRTGRGARLKENPELFSGLIWTGERSVALGLADDLGSLRSVARDAIKADSLVDFTARDDLIERVAKRVGLSAGQALGARLGLTPSVPQLR
jgi:protease-4